MQTDENRKLVLKDRSECFYDAVSLGEVMLRFDPGEGRIRTARSFRVWEGGGEYNVVRGLRRCFGLKTAVLTAFADNEVGRLVEDFILQGGVDTSMICWKKTDGIGRACRNGLNFTERGFGIRGAIGCADHWNTAMSQARPEDFDLERLFGELGVRWFHGMTAGPFPQVRLVATGGLDARSAPEYFAAGASVVAVGSALADPTQLQQLAALVENRTV